MLNGHHLNYNAHALSHITKRVQTPMAELGVGDGETLAPVQSHFKYPSVLKPVLEPQLATNSYEYTQIDGFSDPINETNFPNSTGIGQPLEGWGY